MHVNVLVKTQNIGMQQIEDRETDKEKPRDREFPQQCRKSRLTDKSMAKNGLFANVASFSVG